MTSERKLANSWRTRSGWQWTNERQTFLGCYVLFRAPSSRHLVGALRQLSLILGFHYKLLVRSVALVFQNVFIKMIDWSLWNWWRLSEHALCLSKCPRTYVRTCVSWLVLAPNMRVYIEPVHFNTYPITMHGLILETCPAKTIIILMRYTHSHYVLHAQTYAIDQTFRHE